MLNIFKKSKKLTLGDVVELFLVSEIESNAKISDYTKSDIRRTLFYAIRLKYKDIANDIDFKWFDIWKKELSESGYSAGSAKKYYNFLKRVITWWRSSQNLSPISYPVLNNIIEKQKDDLAADQLLQVYKMIKFLKHKLDESSEGLLDRDHSRYTRCYFTIRFLLSTGIRIQEFNHLKKSDINLAKKELNIGKFVTSNLKGVGRVIPISKDICKLVENYEFINDNLNPYQTGVLKTSYLSQKINAYFKFISKKMNLKSLIFTVSDLRKLYTSLCASQGVDLSFLAATLGHQNTSTTYKYYTKSSLVLKSIKQRRKIRQIFV